MSPLLRFTSLTLLALALSGNSSCEPNPDPVIDSKPVPSDDNGAPSSPDCDCDASIDKDLGDPLTPGGQGSYLINVGYYGSEHCRDGALCIQDVLPAGLTYNSFIGSAWNCSSTDGITVDCCLASATLPDYPVSLAPIEIIVDVADDMAGEEIENCATIVQDDDSFEDSDPTNNESCTTDEIGCGDLDEDLSTGYDDDAAVIFAPEDDEDDWQLVLDTTGGLVPRAPKVVNPYGWLAAFPNTMYVSPTSNGSGNPGSTTSVEYYTYERCFCLSETFSDPSLWLDVRADDSVLAVRLNGAALTPTAGTTGGHADPQPLEFRDPDPSLYKVGQNCIQIETKDAHAVVTGLDVAGNIDSIDGACCELDDDIHDLAIRKTNEDISFTMGGTGTYTLTVTNEGNVNESGFSVVDPLAPDLTFVSNTNTAEWSCVAAPAIPPQTVTCNYVGAPLAPSASTSSDLIVQLADPAVWQSQGPIRNCADVVGAQVDDDPTDNSSCVETPVVCDDLEEDLSTGFDNVPATNAVLGSTDDDWQLVVDSSGDPVPSAPFVVAAYSGWLAPFAGSEWITNSYDGGVRATATSQGLYTYERCWCMSEYAIDPSLLLQVRGDNVITDVRLNGAPLVPFAGTTGAHNDAQPLEYEVLDSTMFVADENCIQVDLNNWSSVAGLNVSGSIDAPGGACCGGDDGGDPTDDPTDDPISDEDDAAN
ncbi:MAG: DUF11 domain-containing protein [Proteobacteria bacterium]|nr:DUF11 domain-containing protein [Pseudomonadota bacterium]